MRSYRAEDVRTLLKNLQVAWQQTRTNQELKQRGGITTNQLSEAVRQEIEIWNSLAGVATRLLDRETAFSRFVQLIQNDWFLLNWYLPEVSPDSEQSWVVAFQTDNFTVPYPFILKKNRLVPTLKKGYRGADFLGDNSFFLGDDEFIIEEKLELKDISPVVYDRKNGPTIKKLPGEEVAIALAYFRAFEDRI